MTTLASLLASVISGLQASSLCRAIKVVQTESFSANQFAFKVRAEINDVYTLQVRIYNNQGHYDYSYQLFADDPVIRWDNKEHFMGLSTQPHHYHNEQGQVEISPLSGDPLNDLPIVLEKVQQFLEKVQEELDP